MTGYSRDELTGFRIEDMETHDSVQRIASRCESCIEQGAVLFEAYHQRKVGSAYPVEMTTGAIRSGDSTYLLAVVADITERKRFREPLQAERERLPVTLTGIGDGVITTDTAGYRRFDQQAGGNIDRFGLRRRRRGNPYGQLLI